jgi:hypothetical protein
MESNAAKDLAEYLSDASDELTELGNMDRRDFPDEEEYEEALKEQTKEVLDSLRDVKKRIDVVILQGV